MNLGPYAKNHVCNQNTRRSFQERKQAAQEKQRLEKIDKEAEKFKLEVDKNLSAELDNFLDTPQGKFTRFLLDTGRY